MREKAMTTFVALLRAVNVAGKNKIPMAELRRALGDAGYRSVETFMQSGNLVFEAEGDDVGMQAAGIHDVILGAFGHDVTVVGLSAEELSGVAAGNPFLAVGAAPRSAVEVDAAVPALETALHATFLESPVDEAAFGGLRLPAQPGELAALAAAPGLAGGVVYLYLPHGYGRTRLNNAYFERALRTPATTRNWRTVVALVEMSARGG